MYQLSEIWIYPIKSVGGISLPEARVELRGLQFDRRWMLTDENGRFLSQRENVTLALLRTGFDAGNLLVWHVDYPDEVLRIPLDLPESMLGETSVKIWSDEVVVQSMPEVFGSWFSEVLKQPVQLTFMPETARRPIDPRYAPEGQFVSFADGYPFLVIGQSTLDDLNSRLPQPIPMNRFRPNFVVTGSAPFEEDSWSNFSIGGTRFRGVKPCARCAIPTIDQRTGFRGVEPTRTLATFRKSDNKILFGQNVIYLDTPGKTVGVGDAVQVHGAG